MCASCMGHTSQATGGHGSVVPAVCPALPTPGSSVRQTQGQILKQLGAIELVALSSDLSLPVRSAQDQVEQILQSSG